jgi:hypothetical protein
MWRTLIVVVLMASCFNLYAQDDNKMSQANAQVERPTFTKDDTWTYRVLNAWTDKELRQYQIDYIDADADKLVLQLTNKTTNTVSTLNTDLDLNVCRPMSDSTAVACMGPYKFPMLIGQKVSYDKYPNEDGSGFIQGDCRVVGTEKITVPAGSFDTYKINCRGFWTNKFGRLVNKAFGNTAEGNFYELIWYAPSAKRFVKSFYEKRHSGGTLAYQETHELMVFKVQ